MKEGTTFGDSLTNQVRNIIWYTYKDVNAVGTHRMATIQFISIRIEDFCYKILTKNFKVTDNVLAMEFQITFWKSSPIFITNV